MNLCSFTGYLTEDPRLTTVNDVSLAEFLLVVYTYRKTKSTGEKNRIPTFIKCEAWHTGAETICKIAQKGSKIHVHCSVKHPSKHSRDIVFRVNEFDLGSPYLEDE
jgi:single-stranded DNA-binding protein